ncbi:unnamed protein product [Phytophthora lilii]|uniref:Unnamed protein product n=1 Tax=Phytophthora lilii TaxID=2077276 RepID=A0A9W6U1F6_9STRA|nr:unnamed protein product [Phytophthora lilii]
MPPSRAKLIHHRWDMHALQALGKRDPDELMRVFTEIKDLPSTAIDTKVKTFGFGAPMQFNTFGKLTSLDTLLLLALRHHDPRSAIALVKLGASRHLSNSANVFPLQAIFDAMAFFRLHPEGTQEKIGDEEDELLKQRSAYEALFSIVEEELAAFYHDKKSKAEQELRELYQRFAPDRVPKIPSQLEAYAYREDVLLDSVKKKYIASLLTM